MGRTARAVAGFLLFLAPIAASLAFAGGASSAGIRCEEKVLGDWSDNGRIDGIYPLRCYQEALAKMPTDLRDYTNATDVIHRALTRAVSSAAERASGTRVAAGVSPQVSGVDRAKAFPLPLVLLVAVSVAVLSAGALGHLARRRRA